MQFSSEYDLLHVYHFNLTIIHYQCPGYCTIINVKLLNELCAYLTRRGHGIGIIICYKEDIYSIMPLSFCCNNLLIGLVDLKFTIREVIATN